MSQAERILRGVEAVIPSLEKAVDQQLSWPMKQRAKEWLESTNGQGFVFDMVKRVLEATDEKEPPDGSDR